MNKNELATILKSHLEFISGNGGIRADLIGADLRGANLRGANLRGANLREAYLIGADLSGANLSGANLREADLREAYLRGAEGIISIGPIGSRSDMLYAVKHKALITLKTGCFWGTLSEFETALNKTHGDNQHARAYRAALALAQIALAELEPETGA